MPARVGEPLILQETPKIWIYVQNVTNLEQGRFGWARSQMIKKIMLTFSQRKPELLTVVSPEDRAPFERTQVGQGAPNGGR